MDDDRFFIVFPDGDWSEFTSFCAFRIADPLHIVEGYELCEFSGLLRLSYLFDRGANPFRFTIRHEADLRTVRGSLGTSIIVDDGATRLFRDGRTMSECLRNQPVYPLWQKDGIQSLAALLRRLEEL